MDEAYARLQIRGHREVWPVRSRRFRAWLAGAFYARYSNPPGAQAFADALLAIDYEARFRSASSAVYVRVAPDGRGGVYVDLADAAWRAVHVTAAGWRVVERPPVDFRRAAGMLALPEPGPGGRLGDLGVFVNVPHDDEWALIKAWLCSALWPDGPYPLLALKGEHGSGKSTLAGLPRKLVDPAEPLLRSNPRESRDLAIAARGNWVVALDNVSRIEPWLSDDLCRLATAAGFATRELYTDFDEVIFKARRPILLNGITDFIARPDLLDRAIQIALPPLPIGDRREERAIQAAFAASGSGSSSGSGSRPAAWPGCGAPVTRGTVRQ